MVADLGLGVVLALALGAARPKSTSRSESSEASSESELSTTCWPSAVMRLLAADGAEVCEGLKGGGSVRLSGALHVAEDCVTLGDFGAVECTVVLELAARGVVSLGNGAKKSLMLLFCTFFCFWPFMASSKWAGQDGSSNGWVKDAWGVEGDVSRHPRAAVRLPNALSPERDAKAWPEIRLHAARCHVHGLLSRTGTGHRSDLGTVPAMAAPCLNLSAVYNERHRNGRAPASVCDQGVMARRRVRTASRIFVHGAGRAVLDE